MKSTNMLTSLLTLLFVLIAVLLLSGFILGSLILSLVLASVVLTGVGLWAIVRMISRHRPRLRSLTPPLLGALVVLAILGLGGQFYYVQHEADLQAAIQQRLAAQTAEESAALKWTEVLEVAEAALIPLIEDNSDTPEKQAEQLAEQARLRREQYPDWLKNAEVVIEKSNLLEWAAPHQQLPESYVISSGHFATRQEAEEEARRLAHRLFEGSLPHYFVPHIRHMAFPWKPHEWDALPLIQNTYFEPIQMALLDNMQAEMYRCHLQVRISETGWEALTAQVLTKTKQKRSGALGVLMVIGMAGSGFLGLLLSRKSRDKKLGKSLGKSPFSPEKN